MNLNELTISQARQGLKEKKFSSKELVKACLAKIKAHDSKINAFITVCEKEALKQAEKADLNLPLGGIPMAIKDIFNTSEIRTTAGSRVLENYIPVYDATVVAKLKKAGAIIIGKTNMDAWAHGSSGENSDFGSTRNPLDLNLVPGGSSSGSAAAVAANMCLAATGTDTGGSIRLPAFFCRVVGLKPTYGRVSRFGVIAMASSLDSIGHLTKDVTDAALILNITAGKDSHDATTPDISVPDYTANLNKGIKNLKIGVAKEYPKISKAAKRLEDLGAKVIEISLPHTKYSVATYYLIQPAEVSSNLARFDGIRFGFGRDKFGDEAKRRIMLGTFCLSTGYYDAYYLKAMKVRTLIKQDFEKALKKVEVIIGPVSPTPAFKLGEKVTDPLVMYLSDILTVPANLAGLPALALPDGIQILGPQFSESLLFQVGNAYEKKD